jgi:16S rRNA G966 N2-methylase RsmD
MTFEEFIIAHEKDDTARLLLGRSKWPEVDIDLAVNTIECRRNLKFKLPRWYANPGIVYPTRLSAEQCSSEATASYKANLCKRILSGKNGVIADLTGGLGVDTAAFANISETVIYNEMDSRLCEAAEHNFKCLGIDNVEIRNEIATKGNIEKIIGKGNRPDIIFLDPARRAKDGKKVFLLEDCSPNILEMEDELLAISPNVVAKLSPMADISMAVNRLGTRVREVHILAENDECKELLIWLDRDWKGGYEIIAFNSGQSISFSVSEENSEKPVFPENEPSLLTSSGLYLFEPGKALLKAGAFNLLCRYGLTKLGRFTHLFLGMNPGTLKGQCKVFPIKEIHPLNNRNIKEFGKKYGKGEVTAKNIPLSSEGLRKKMGLASGGEVHIFGVHIDFNEGQGNYLIITGNRL